MATNNSKRDQLKIDSILIGIAMAYAENGGQMMETCAENLINIINEI